MVSQSLNMGLFPFQMAFLWIKNQGLLNHLLTGMILEVGVNSVTPCIMIGSGARRGSGRPNQGLQHEGFEVWKRSEKMRIGSKNLIIFHEILAALIGIPTMGL